ncbi:hypothetical protein F4808DRAFT_79805 [Astrocystis sublimbata]|nr:hypothetical protein F4808DRAFT_79805 [Astrocystis sublimbata]
MAPKKAEGGAAAAPKTKSAPHASYQDMITDAIVALKDRTGSSRQSLKKYVKANNTINAGDVMFDSLFNRALKAGVDKGIFEQPKGPSGTTKLSKQHKTAASKPAPKKEGEKEVKKAAPKKEKEPAKKATTAKKPAAKKEKDAGEKKPAAKKAAAPKKAAPKKAAAAKKDVRDLPRWSNIHKLKPGQAPAAAADKPAALTKTKSGRVAKTAAKPAGKRAAAPKTAAPKKEKAPKKEAKAEAAS